MRRLAAAIVTTVLAVVALAAVPGSESPHSRPGRVEGERLVREKPELNEILAKLVK